MIFQQKSRKMADWKEFGRGLAQSAISQGASSILGALFGPSKKKIISMQKQAQMELNRDAANINYQYGERAAENAYKRQMAMYERSYNDQSYGAMRQQMENAGLSVGLMYGQGASGGGQGAMSGAPQGETGGAVAGNAAEQLSTAIALKQLKIQEATAMAQNAKAYAEAGEINQRREKEATETEQSKESFGARLRRIWLENEKTWIDNKLKRFMAAADDFEDKTTITDDEFEVLEIRAKGLFNRELINDTIDTLTKQKDVEGANELRAAEAALANEKTRTNGYVVAAALLTAVANKENAESARMNAITSRMEYGLHKLATESNIKLNDAEIQKIGLAMTLDAEGMSLKAAKTWQEIEESRKRTEFDYGAWGKFKTMCQGFSAMANACSGMVNAYSGMVNAGANAIDAVVPF